MQRSTRARAAAGLTAAIAAAAAVVFPAGFAHGQLMVPDSGAGDRVMLFSSQDGLLIDANWITDAAAVGWQFTTPKEAAVVGNEIWVSDQVADSIVRFDSNRQFVGIVNSLAGGAGNFDNVRGFGYDGQTVYLTMSHSSTALRGVVTIDAATATSTGFFAVGTNSLFDAEPFGGDLLISNSTTNDVERRNRTTGALISVFAPDITFPQQVTPVPDGSVLNVSTIAAAGVEGIYHHNADGSVRRYIDTQAIKTAAGELVPHGAWLLGNGDYFLATSIGVFTIRPTGAGPLDYTFATVITGVDAQYVNAIPEPAVLPVACAVAAAATVVTRRRQRLA
jgi:hypothetical protein